MATLKTALALDSAEFEREFAKASAVVSRYAASVEQQGNRSLQRARGEVEALRLEATGHQQAAEALRQKIAIEEQATALAKQTGLSQQNAIQLTTRRIELETQLAAQQARTARINPGGGGGRPALPELPLTSAEMNRAFVATSKFNSQLALMGKAGKNGSLGLLAVSQAVEDAQYGIKGVLNNIPQAIMGFGGSAGLAGAISLAVVAGYQLVKVMYELGGGSAAKKMLEAVKAQQAAMDAFTAAQRKNIEAGKDRRREIELSAQLSEIAARQELKTARTLGVDPAAEEAYQRQIRAVERLRQQRDALAQASSRSDGADALAATRAKFINEEADAAADLAAAQQRLIDSGKEWERVWNNLSETGSDLFTKANAATAKAEEVQLLLNGRTQELAALRAGSENATEADKRLGVFTRAIQAKEDAVSDLTAKLNELRAIEEKYNQLLADARSTGAASLEEFKKRQAAAREEIEIQKQRIQLNQELARIEADRIKAQTAESRKQFNEEMEVLRAQLAGDQDKLDALDRQKRIEEEILRLKKEQLGITDAQARAKATEKAAAQDAIRDKEKSNKSRAVFLQTGQEMQVLRLRAAGREKEAKALEQEFQARAAAIKLAKDANISEDQALKIVRERQRLLDQIESNEKGSKQRRNSGANGRSPIYMKNDGDRRLLPRGGAVGGLRTGGLQGARAGLSAAVADRAAQSRPRDPQADARRAAESYYQKNLEQNEELLKIWRTLGVG